MAPTTSAPLIAVFNTSTEIVEMLRMALEDDGLPTVGAITTPFKRTQSDLDSFLAQHHGYVVTR